MNNFLRYLWMLATWKPERDLWGMLYDVPALQELADSVRYSVAGWIGNQMSEMLKLLSSLLLSFPTHFIEMPAFTEIYYLVTASALLLMPAILVFRSVSAIAGSSKWHMIEAGDLVGTIVKFAVSSLFCFRAPWIFVVLMDGANSMVSSLISQAQVNLLYDSLTKGVGVDLIIVSLLVVVLVYSVRLIVYYAVRNMHLLWLLLQTPVVLVRWAVFQADILLDWWNQILGLILVQVLHALLFLILVKFVNAGPPPGVSAKLSKLWLVLGQIGIMELMIKPNLIMRYVVNIVPLNTPEVSIATVRKMVGKAASLGRMVPRA